MTASHNPKQWNALKLLNDKGEFISKKDGEKLLEIIRNNKTSYNDVDNLGQVTQMSNYMDMHIEHILQLDGVEINEIRKANFKIVIDAVNSTGGIALPKLLKALGCEEITELYCEPNGQFPHNPEPLPAHLEKLSETVINEKADLGIVVDPDVDRLAFVCENGEVFGEEYTLVAVSDHILSRSSGNTVSNLSSTRALRDVTEKHGGKYCASAVGEVNVVNMMKEKNAVIGGEGNGGVIYPSSHYGRDALVGIALFLTHLAKKNMSISELRASYPNYVISKNKVELTPSIDIDNLVSKISKKYSHVEQNVIDGLKLEFEDEWVHLRKSNTEPIIRIYAESKDVEKANMLASRFVEEVKSLM